MTENSRNRSPKKLTVQSLHTERDWPANGAVYLNGWTIERLTLPPDEIVVPALTEHVIAISCDHSDRQISRFAGQEYDGVGHKNTFYIVPAGTPAKFAWESEDTGIVFGIASRVLKRTAEQVECPHVDRVELNPIIFAHDRQIAHLASCLTEEMFVGGMGHRLYCESLLMVFAIHLLRHYCTFETKFIDPSSGLSPAKLHEVLDYIDSSLADGDTSLSTIARIANLSDYYFARQFKQSMGLAPHQYVIQQRVKKAERLLKQKKLSIKQVAEECGFSSQSHFGKVFYQIVGTTPKRYQQECE